MGRGVRVAALLGACACAVFAGYGSAAAGNSAAPLKAKWTAKSRTYREGHKDVTVVYGAAVNYQDAQGVWQPIDDSLVQSSEAGYAFENKADGYKLRVPADLAGAPVQLDLGKAEIAFGLRGAHGKGAASGATARFAGALGHTDVSYTATSAGARELLTLTSAAAPQSFTYDLKLKGGVEAQQLGPRTVAFVKDGKAVALFVAPSMRDAAGAISDAISVTLADGAITVTPDRAWLTSASRAWPVSVDPDVLTLQGAAQDTYIESGNPDTYFGGDPLLQVGYDGTQAIRGMLNFNVDMYVPAGTTVDSAQLSLYLEAQKSDAATPVSVQDVVVAWGAPTWRRYDFDYQNRVDLLWNTPGGDVDDSVASTATPGAIGTTTTWDVTQLVQRQVSGLVPPYGFRLEQQGESTVQVYGFNSSWSYDGNPIPTLTITYEEPSQTGPQVSILTGNGVTFGSTPVGTAAPTQEVDLRNSGDAPLHVTGFGIGGANPGDFSVVSDTCTSAPIEQWAMCSITLSATPQAAGNRTATLAINDDAPNTPQYIALTVNGTTPAGASVSPSSLAFGTLRVGTTSSVQTVTVTSTGGAPLSITGVSRTGTNPSDFSVVSDACSGRQLAPGTSCTIGVRAKPRARGTRTATLRISDNAPGGSQSVGLSVTGA